MKREMPKVLGQRKGVVMLNNAATTPPFVLSIKALGQFLRTYGAFHRGSGPYAEATYSQTHRAIRTIKKFVGAQRDTELLFAINTSHAINILARLLNFKKNDVIITSIIEHTSNNLPWRFNTKATLVTVRCFADGSLDMADLGVKIRKYKNKLKLVALTGASNLTGYVPDIKMIARLTHKTGALLFIDAAQLAPHRPIAMSKEGIDILAFSAHKIYAPFGLGVLALPCVLLERIPVDPGGGSVDMISEDSVLWSPVEVRHQSGTWNVAGILALAESCRIISRTGWKKIVAHERKLLNYAVTRMVKVPGLVLHVPKEKYFSGDRIGTIVFSLPPYHHALLSAILSEEYGIESRAGTICNHRLVRSWFGISDKQQLGIEKKIRKGNRLASYGINRVSLGLHNTKQDIDKLLLALQGIATHGPRKKYKAILKQEIYETRN